uniref:Putative ovule protein n=1 Tax=Solanum chacoense TaxID=4108 RepID=A0A0V0GY11_SOLCH
MKLTKAMKKLKFWSKKEEEKRELLSLSDHHHRHHQSSHAITTVLIITQFSHLHHPCHLGSSTCSHMMTQFTQQSKFQVQHQTIQINLMVVLFLSTSIMLVKSINQNQHCQIIVCLNSIWFRIKCMAYL